MTPPRPAGERICDEPLCTVTLPHHTHVDVADRAWCCGPYPYTARPASPPAGAEGAATRIAESRISIAAALRERDELRAKVAALVRERDELRAQMTAAEEAVARVEALVDEVDARPRYLTGDDLRRALDDR